MASAVRQSRLQTEDVPVRQEPPNRRGFGILRRGLPEENASPDEVMWNYERLPARFGHAGAWLIIYVNERSYRGASVPVSLAALSIFLNVSERRVRDIVDEVI